MPAFNAAQFVNQAIESVKVQSNPDWELIIVNDGSTDLTEELIRIASKNDSRIKLITQINKKQAGARNTGLMSA